MTCDDKTELCQQEHLEIINKGKQEPCFCVITKLFNSVQEAKTIFKDGVSEVNKLERSFIAFLFKNKFSTPGFLDCLTS